jgi:uncharacterized protein (TIGR02118 family)
LATLLVLYKTPKDPAAFDKYYAEIHIPLAKKMPGLTSYRVSRGPVTLAGGQSSVHMTATLTFDSLATLQAALEAPEGKAAGADVPNFASGGADLYMFDDAPV